MDKQKKELEDRLKKLEVSFKMATEKDHDYKRSLDIAYEITCIKKAIKLLIIDSGKKNE